MKRIGRYPHRQAQLGVRAWRVGLWRVSQKSVGRWVGGGVLEDRECGRERGVSVDICGIVGVDLIHEDGCSRREATK